MIYLVYNLVIFILLKSWALTILLFCNYFLLLLIYIFLSSSDLIYYETFHKSGSGEDNGITLIIRQLTGLKCVLVSHSTRSIIMISFPRVARENCILLVDRNCGFSVSKCPALSLI